MDPEKCLAQAEGHLKEASYEDCGDDLQDYREWRGQGGFEPSHGDLRHDLCLRGLAAKTSQGRDLPYLSGSVKEGGPSEVSYDSLETRQEKDGTFTFQIRGLCYGGSPEGFSANLYEEQAVELASWILQRTRV